MSLTRFEGLQETIICEAHKTLSIVSKCLHQKVNHSLIYKVYILTYSSGRRAKHSVNPERLPCGHPAPAECPPCAVVIPCDVSNAHFCWIIHDL